MSEVPSIPQLDDLQEPEAVDLSTPELVAWAFRKLRNCRSRIAENVATADAMRAKILKEIEAVDAWLAQETKADASTIAYMTAQLEAHLLNARAADPNCKGIKTPWGVIESREQQPDFERNDEELLAWLNAYEPQLVRVKTILSPAWDEVKACCMIRGERLVIADGERAGEALPGVTVKPKPLRVSVKVFDA